MATAAMAIATAEVEQPLIPSLPGNRVLALATAPPESYKWHRGDAVGVSDSRCVWCFGLGLRKGLHASTQPCNCTLRGIFRAVLRHIDRKLETRDGYSPKCTISALIERGVVSTNRNFVWGYKDAEYRADFELIAKRTLKPLEFRIFRLHHIEGFHWLDCTRALKIEKGPFFHACYRIEQKVGRACREVRPYALYPLHEYYESANETSPSLDQRISAPSPMRRVPQN